MSLVKCKCGRYTNNGLLCTSCQKDSSIDSFYDPPKDTEEEELEELGFTICDDLEEYEEEYED
jgi:tRNA nucleotidyltransferase (CCA-adding enzyme)